MTRQQAIDTAVRQVLRRGWYVVDRSDEMLVRLAGDIADAVRAEFQFIVSTADRNANGVELCR
jgi:hypothetical protein